MHKRRATNNSVSTLEEQSLLLRIMSDQGSSSSGMPTEDSGDKRGKSHRKKSSARSTSTKSAGSGSGSAAGGAGDIVTTAGAGLTKGSNTVSVSSPQPVVTTVTASTGGGVQPHLTQLASHLGCGAQAFQGGVMQQPFLQPPQLLPYPYYPQPFQGFMPQLAFQEPQEASEWGEGEQASVDGESVLDSLDGRRAHSVSDEEEEGEESVQALRAPQEAGTKPTLNLEGLKPGKMAEFLKQAHQKTVEADKVGEEINPTLAGIIGEFFDETKLTSEIDRIAKEFPRVKNIKKLVVPKLDQELFTALDQNARAADISIQLVQKAATATVSALAPLAALMMERGDGDEELDAFSGSIMKAIQLSALATNALSSRRREMLKPSMQHAYAKAMVKAHDGAPEWLFGGNLSDVTKKCEIAKRVADKIVKRKQPQQQQGNQQQRQNGGAGGKNQGKRFKGNNNQQSGQKFYGYGLQNFPYQFQTPYQQGGYQYQGYKPRQQYQAQGYQQQHQGQQQQGQQQDFRPRGPRK